MKLNEDVLCFTPHEEETIILIFLDYLEKSAILDQLIEERMRAAWYFVDYDHAGMQDRIIMLQAFG